MKISYHAMNIVGVLIYVGAGVWAQSSSSPNSMVITCLVFFGVALLVYSLSIMARDRGYHPAWGVLGALGVLGILAAYFAPDRRRHLR